MLLVGSPQPTTPNYVCGNLGNASKLCSNVSSFGPRSQTLTIPSSTGSGPQYNKYYGRARPHYDERRTITLNVTNGTDVTISLQAQLLQLAATSNAAFLPYGSYYVTDTIYLPPGTRLFGEVWSRLIASGPNFANSKSPRPVLLAGKPGDNGVIQVQDILVTTNDTAPGAILMQWNIDCNLKEDVCGMWDVHFRVGGATGSFFSSCGQTVTMSQHPECQGVFLILHIAPTATGIYLQNVWGWTADHNIDSGQTLNVYSARGLLVESRQGPVWLYGVAMEHNFLYQMNLFNASNVLLSVPQTESPYYQPEFPLQSYENLLPSDPQIDNATYGAIALSIVNPGEFISLYGSGFYSFFRRWDTSCSQNRWNTSMIPCQFSALTYLESEGADARIPATLPVGLRMFSVNAHGSPALMRELFFKNHDVMDLDGSLYPNDFCQTMFTWNG
eukprot:PhF_6_TR16961/c0_g1_i2/m.25591